MIPEKLNENFIAESEKLIDLLVKNGANINATDRSGETPIFYLNFEGI